MRPRYQIDSPKDSEQRARRVISGLPRRALPTRAWNSLGDDVPLIADYGTPKALADMLNAPIHGSSKVVQLDKLYILVGRKLLDAKKAGRLEEPRGVDPVNSYVLSMREWRNFVAEQNRFGSPIIDSEITFWHDRLAYGIYPVLKKIGVV